MNVLKFLKLPKLSRRESISALVCILVLLVLFLDRVMLRSLWSRSRSIREEIQTLEQAVANHRKLLSRKGIISVDLEIYGDYLQPAASEEVEMAKLLKEIEGFTKESKVSVSRIRPLPGEEGDLYQEFVIEVECRSSLEQWLRFVYLIESSRSLFDIQKARLAREEGEERLKGYLILSKIAMRGEVGPEGLGEVRPEGMMEVK